MKFLFTILVITVAGSVVGAKKPSKNKPNKEKPSKQKDGLCIDGEKMMMMCMADTDMGEKSKAAMETCGDGKKGSERSLDLMRKKGKGKPSKGKCPKAEAVLKVVLEKYSWE